MLDKEEKVVEAMASLFNDNPVWNAPDTIAYVIVDEPSASVAEIVCENAWVNVAAFNVVDVTQTGTAPEVIAFNDIADNSKGGPEFHVRYIIKHVKQMKKFYAHAEQNQAKPGDTVRIMETRPLSKLKRWRLVEVVQK